MSLHFVNIFFNFFLLIVNSLILYKCFGLLSKIEFLENNYKILANTLQIFTSNQSTTNYSDLYFYGSLGILLLLFIFYVNNEFFLINQKIDIYQSDLLKNLEDIISNGISPSQTEHLFSQTCNILLNQDIIIRTLETVNNKPFQADPAAIKYAELLSQVFN